MRSVMVHQFSQVPSTSIPRSVFDRSHGYKTTFDSGYLVPVFWDLAYPGDTFNLRMNAFARLTTPEVPFMDNMFMDSFFFSVPLRLIWDNFQRFMGEQPNPGDSTDFLIPQMPAPTTTGFAIGSLADYFGVPTGIDGFSINSWLHRSYNLIYNEWFRDENLQNSVPVDKDDGPDDPADYVLLRRGKRHDYFTSCLPWPQKGPAVTLPLGTEAPLKGKNWEGAQNNYLYVKTPTLVPGGGRFKTSTGDPGTLKYEGLYDGGVEFVQWQDKDQFTGSANAGYNYADLSEASAATINQLRQAFQIQAMYEKDARGGTRYVEINRSHFNVVSPDARLQRPEYLGGGSTPVSVSPIAQTSATAEDSSPQGNLAAIGTISSRGNGFSKSFVEHCIVIGLISVRADLNYQQGLNRMFSYRTRLDMYWPSLANIGEQAVLNQEIYLQGDANDDDVFGYQERYAEMRYKPSLITGKFRSQAPDTLDVWHLAQEFGSLPTLSSTFIQDNPPVARVLAVQDEPQFLFDSRFFYKCARPMPTYGVPFSLGRF